MFDSYQVNIFLFFRGSKVTFIFLVQSTVTMTFYYHLTFSEDFASMQFTMTKANFNWSI